jgi:hypothetical protein
MNDFATTRPNWARMSMNDALNNFDSELGAIVRAHNLNRPGHRGITDAVVRESTIQAFTDAVTTVAEVIEPLQWQLASNERFCPEPRVFMVGGVTHAIRAITDIPDENDPDGEIFMQTLRELRQVESDDDWDMTWEPPEEPLDPTLMEALAEEFDEITDIVHTNDEHGNCWLSGPGFSGLPCGDPTHQIVVPEQDLPPDE